MTQVETQKMLTMFGQLEKCSIQFLLNKEVRSMAAAISHITQGDVKRTSAYYVTNCQDALRTSKLKTKVSVANMDD